MALIELAMCVGITLLIGGIVFGVTMFLIWWWHQTFM